MKNKFSIKIKGEVFTSDEDGYLDLNEIWNEFKLSESKKPSKWRNAVSQLFKYEEKLIIKEVTHIGADFSKFYSADEEATIEYCKWVRLPVDSHGVSIITMRKEHFVGDLLEQIFPDLQRQVEILDGKYFLDFYVPSEDLVIEYDELHHNSLTNQEKDRKREKEIGKIVFRISEGSEVEDILFLKQTYCK